MLFRCSLRSSLAASCDRVPVLSSFVICHVMPNFACMQGGTTPLKVAIMQGHTSVRDYLISKGAGEQRSSSWGQYCLACLNYTALLAWLQVFKQAADCAGHTCTWGCSSRYMTRSTATACNLHIPVIESLLSYLSCLQMWMMKCER